MAILITGGAGYIGSHTCVEMLEAGYEAVVVDNFSNSSMESINRVEKLTGKKIKFYEADVCDKAALEKIFTNRRTYKHMDKIYMTEQISLFDYMETD